MILANIEAEIEAKTEQRENIFSELEKIDDLILDLKCQKDILLDKDTDLYYEIEELKEQMNELQNEY